MTLVLAALAVLVGSGLGAAALSRWPRASTALGSGGVLVAAALGLGPALRALSGETLAARWPWAPPYGDLLVGLDRLSAFFLLPVLVLGSAAALYGRAYLLQGKRRPLGPPVLFFNLLVASLTLILIARDVMLLVLAWEAMGLTSFLVVSFEHQQASVRRAGWVYLVASQLGAMVFIAVVLLLVRQAGSTEYAAIQQMPQPGPWLSGLLVALAVIACGVKAGLVPFHVWLPEAHAAAPSHMSAMMSGASLKVALYALLRTLGFLQPAAWWGPFLILGGFAGAGFGISQALAQRDFKRVLAYSSIENMGLVVIGVGLGYWGTAAHLPAVAALGALAAGFHLWSHVLMKGMLFLSAGSVLHGTGTLDLEQMGGLLHRMPRTAALALLGSVAIAGLPPLNGFVGEWLLMRGLFASGVTGTGASGVAPLLAVGALAFVGALAALCFVRLFGIALLGSPRTPAAAHAHESTAGILLPILALGLGCVALSLRPALALRPVAAFAAQVFGVPVGAGVEALGPSLGTLGALSGVVALLVALLGAALASRLPRVAAARPGTWDCGYAAPDARMQYTARSFSDFAAGFFPRALAPQTKTQGPSGLFPAPGSLATEEKDPLTRGWYEPLFTGVADRFVKLRWLQQGELHAYLFYILAMVVTALSWVSLRGLWSGP